MLLETFNNCRKGDFQCTGREFSHTATSSNIKDKNITIYDPDKEICTQSDEDATQFLPVAKSKMQEKSKEKNA